MKPWLNKDYLLSEYVSKERSTKNIAAEHGVYPNTIRRALKKFGIEIRGRSIAQQAHLRHHTHPFEGRKRTEEEKQRISSGLNNYWQNLEEKDKEQIISKMSATAKSLWESLSDDQKSMSIKRMNRHNRERMGHGSRNENLVADLLRDAGFSVFQRTNEFSPERQFEIDICIPSERVAIEWDGPAHFEPIFGEDKLEKVQEKDERKNAMLTAAGWAVIRCYDYSTSHSLAFCSRAVESIIECMRNIQPKKVYFIQAT